MSKKYRTQPLFAHDIIVTLCRSYPPESDRERRIRFVSEVNAMASIRSKHTVPLLGIMFGVQGQEDSLGLSIGTESIDKSNVATSSSPLFAGSSGRLPRESETQRIGGGDMKPLARISLVMPFYSLGSLGERLRHGKLPRLSWLHKLLLCWDIVSGIMDSHKAAVIHKDIKCDNIVLEQDELDLGENTLLRGVVCDFGLANVAKQVCDASFCFAVPGLWRLFLFVFSLLILASRVTRQSAALVSSSHPKFGSTSAKAPKATGKGRTKPPATCIRLA